MKHKNRSFSAASLTCCLIFFAVSGPVPVHAQSASTGEGKSDPQKALIKSLVDSQNYVFEAQMALPMGGRSRQLTGDFDLTVGKTAVVSYLPYFGRAYLAPVDPAQAGIQFTSKDFEYNVRQGKKGSWSVSIKPHDAGDVQQLSMDISADGYATLQVISTTKQAISFNGVIEQVKSKTRKH